MLTSRALIRTQQRRWLQLSGLQQPRWSPPSKSPCRLPREQQQQPARLTHPSMQWTLSPSLRMCGFRQLCSATTHAAAQELRGGAYPQLWMQTWMICTQSPGPRLNGCKQLWQSQMQAVSRPALATSRSPAGGSSLPRSGNTSA